MTTVWCLGPAIYGHYRPKWLCVVVFKYTSKVYLAAVTLQGQPAICYCSVIALCDCLVQQHLHIC